MQTTPPSRRWPGLSLLILAALAAFYLATVLPELGNDPIVGGDEGWIMSASAKLAEGGGFGSDLFTGFYNANHDYFFNLPLQHLLIAGVFRLLGVGVWQARLLSMIAGLAALALTYALGRRLGGEAVGLGAAALLTLLRLNLAPFSGLTLTDLGATVRYDLPAVPYALAAVLLLAPRERAPGFVAVALAGVLIGLGTLTQFIAGFVLPPLALYLLTTRGPAPSRRLLLTGVLALTTLLTLLPYGGYILAHRSDFEGQSRSVEQQHAFSSPAFYWRQLREEPSRYAAGPALQALPRTPRALLSRPSARLALLLLVPIVLLRALLLARRDDRQRLLLFLLAGLVVELALFESTKRYVYAVILVPFVCTGIADLGVAAWRWRPSLPRLGMVMRGVVVAVALLFAGEGLAVAAKDVLDARDAPSYAALTTRLQAALPAGAVVIGDNRLWPALGGRERSLLLLFYFTNPRISRDSATDIPSAFQRIDAGYLLLSPLSYDILGGLSPRDSADFAAYLQSHADLETTVPDSAYGPIEVYRLKP